MKTFFLLLALLAGTLEFSAQSTSKIFEMINKIHLPGDAGWDYLYSDDSSGRLYVSHGSMVQVVDEATGQLAGTISGMKGIHGIAIVSDLHRGYISCGRDTMVTVFDTQTFDVLAKIKVTGLNPDAIVYDSFSKKVFVFNGRSSSATVIDVTADEVVATISLPGKPEFSVSDGKGNVFVNLEDVSNLCRINSITLKVEQVWPLAPGEGPSGLAMDKENDLLFSVCDNKTMVVSDAKNGTVLTTEPIGGNVDGVAFDPVLKLVYSSNGEGTLSVIKEISKDNFKTVATIFTRKRAATIAVNAKTHHIYLPTADFEPASGGNANAQARPKIVVNSFTVLDLAPAK